VVFVWSVDNWGPGQPLEFFKSTNGFQGNANNDVDFDNNGFGNAFSDIFSGIITLTNDGEPLNDGDPVNCYFNYDACGNNSVDFGFYNPSVSAVTDISAHDLSIQIIPNPVLNAFSIKGNLGVYQVDIYDAFGRLLRKMDAISAAQPVDIASFPAGLYFVKVANETNMQSRMLKVVKL
jgi:hypothetical protein